MVRLFAVAAILLCVVTSVLAQTPPATDSAATQAAAPIVKPVEKKQAPKNKSATMAPVDSGRCQIGVIPAIGDVFGVQKIGITVFGNEYTEVPIEAWDLDDLVVTRVRAALPGTSVKRIAYPKAAFEPIDHPAPAFFHNTRDDLIAIVRQIATYAGCERYVVVTRSPHQLANTNQTNLGVGVMTSNSLLGHPVLFAYFNVFVFDGRTFEIAKAPDIDIAEALLEPFRLQDPLTGLDNSLFPEPASAAASSVVLRDRTRAYLSVRLDKYLPPYLKQE
jgi:hypothetical protein